MRRALVVALVVASVVTVPTAAEAARNRGHFDFPAGHVTRFELGGTNGYRITVSANDRGFVTVKARKGPALVAYVVAGRVLGNGGQARLPGLGSVSFSFTPTGRVRTLEPYSNCDGERFVQRGVARGRVVLHEDGLTRVRAHRVRAEVRSWSEQHCRYLRWRQREQPAELIAFDPGRPFVEFTATRYRAEARPYSRRIGFEASVSSSRSGMYISRSISIAASPPTLRVPDPGVPENIVIEPPAPFSGSAELVRTPESTFVWKGSLRVELPGAKPLALTGPRFITRYCALRGCAEQFPADFPF